MSSDDDVHRQASNRKLPTFLYAMPFSDTRIFLEETSLVARPAVPFPDLKVRSWSVATYLSLVCCKSSSRCRCRRPGQNKSCYPITKLSGSARSSGPLMLSARTEPTLSNSRALNPQ